MRCGYLDVHPLTSVGALLTMSTHPFEEEEEWVDKATAMAIAGPLWGPEAEMMWEHVPKDEQGRITKEAFEQAAPLLGLQLPLAMPAAPPAAAAAGNGAAADLLADGKMLMDVEDQITARLQELNGDDDEGSPPQWGPHP